MVRFPSQKPLATGKRRDVSRNCHHVTNDGGTLFVWPPRRAQIRFQAQPIWEMSVLMMPPVTLAFRPSVRLKTTSRRAGATACPVSGLKHRQHVKPSRCADPSQVESHRRFFSGRLRPHFGSTLPGTRTFQRRRPSTCVMPTANVRSSPREAHRIRVVSALKSPIRYPPHVNNLSRRRDISVT